MLNNWSKIHDAVKKFEAFESHDIIFGDRPDKDSQFFVEVKSGSRIAILKYSWPEPSNTLDVLLIEDDAKRSFVIYMTDHDLSDWPELIEQAYLICAKFLNADYTFKSAGFWRKRMDIYFNDPQITYKYASPTKEFINPQVFRVKKAI